MNGDWLFHGLVTQTLLSHLACRLRIWINKALRQRSTSLGTCSVGLAVAEVLDASDYR